MQTDASDISPILTQMFEQAPTFMAPLTGPEHRFELANPSYVKLVGREVAGRTVAEALPMLRVRFSPAAAFPQTVR